MLPPVDNTLQPNRGIYDYPEKRSQKSRDEVVPNPIETTTSGTLLLQSLLRLHAHRNRRAITLLNDASSLPQGQSR